MRPKAQNILGLDKDEPFSMGNTMSTNGNRVQLLVAGKDGKEGTIISSIENSSVENNQAAPLDAKLGNKNIMVNNETSPAPELAHPPPVRVQDAQD